MHIATCSPEFLGDADEEAFGSADVAEPIRVLVLDHFEAFKLSAVLAEPDEPSRRCRQRQT